MMKESFTAGLTLLLTMKSPLHGIIPLFVCCLPLGAAPATDPKTATTDAREIDALLVKDWKANNILPNPPASDEVFVRRVYLDVIGRIPTTGDATAFFESKQPNKRAVLISSLLDSEGYVQHFYNYWADVLRLQSQGAQAGPTTGYAYSNYIRLSLRENKPYDRLASELVSATGLAWENGAIGYYMRDKGMPLDNMALTSRVFLGTRIECAQCHNHPFADWTQKEFYEMAAFTYGVNEGDTDKRIGLRDASKARTDEINAQYARDKATDLVKAKQQHDAALAAHGKVSKNVNTVLNQINGSTLRGTEQVERDRDLKLPADYKYKDVPPLSVVKPATIMGAPVAPYSGMRRTEVFAKWMTSPENPCFTKVLANRLWRQAFGVALIEPLDDLTEDAKAMIPDLEEHLEKLLIARHYNMKAYLAALLNTRAYQAAATREEYHAGEIYHFTGPVLRRMAAEQIWDSFVTLIRPDPDTRNLVAEAEAEQRMSIVRKLNDALVATPPTELFDHFVAASSPYSERGTQLKTLQIQISEARAKEDKERVKELTSQVSAYEALAQKAVIDNILNPVLIKLQEKVTGHPAKAPSEVGAEKSNLAGGGEMQGMEMQKSYGGNSITQFLKTMTIPGYDKPSQTNAQETAQREAQRNAFSADADALGLSAKERPQYLEYRKRAAREWLRAAELESPAPRGHFLRELGQSDRDFVENGSSAASVPQALLLMNSQLIPQILSPFSPLMQGVNRATTAEGKLEAVCLTLFSRKPTAREKAVWATAVAGGMSSADDLVFALLNTQQFIFIQ